MTQGNDLIQFNMDSSLANGLTKREYFAAMAMQGILANNIRYGDFNEAAK